VVIANRGGGSLQFGRAAFFHAEGVSTNLADPQVKLTMSFGVLLKRGPTRQPIRWQIRHL
jgi:hypothetical protein